jgi:hypothetical protein
LSQLAKPITDAERDAPDKAAGQGERARYVPLGSSGIVDNFVRGVRILRVVISTAVNIYLIQIIGNRIERMGGSASFLVALLVALALSI